MPGRRGPTLRSRWLGGLLREARAESGKTLRDAAAYLAVDVSTMSRYESGRIPAQPRHVGALLDLYGVGEVQRQDALIELSREAWRRDWWDAYEPDVSPSAIDHAWLEDRATMIRSFDTMTLMGLVQTRPYAEAITRADHQAQDLDPGDHLTADHIAHRIAHRVEFGMERQRVFRKQSPPRVSIVLDECLLHRPVGGPRVMFVQLGRLTELAESGTVELQVLPASTGAHAGQLGAFQIYDLPGPYPQVGYTETVAGPTFTASADTQRFTRAYERLQEAALGPDTSTALITTAAREMTKVSTS